MFDVGQKVICVRKEPWALIAGIPGLGGPAFGEECTIDGFWPKGTLLQTPVSISRTELDSVGLDEWGGSNTAIYHALWFRPRDPNIEALRSLVTKLPVKQPVEV